MANPIIDLLTGDVGRQSIEAAATEVSTHVASSESAKNIARQVLKRIPGMTGFLSALPRDNTFYEMLGIGLSPFVSVIANSIFPGSTNPNVIRARELIVKIGPHLATAAGRGIGNSVEYESMIDEMVDDVDAGRAPRILTGTDGNAVAMGAWSPYCDDRSYHVVIPNDSKNEEDRKKTPWIIFCGNYLRTKQCHGAGWIELIMPQDWFVNHGFRQASCCGELAGLVSQSITDGVPSSKFMLFDDHGRDVLDAFTRTMKTKNWVEEERGIDYGKEIMENADPLAWNHFALGITITRSGTLSKKDYEDVISWVRIFAKGTLEFWDKVLQGSTRLFLFLKTKSMRLKTWQKITAIVIAVLVALTSGLFSSLIVSSFFLLFAGSILGFVIAATVPALSPVWGPGLMALSLAFLFLCRIPWVSVQKTVNSVMKKLPFGWDPVRWMKDVGDEVFAFFALASWLFLWLHIFFAPLAPRIALWLIFLITAGYRHYAKRSGHLQWIWDLDFGTSKTFRVLTTAHLVGILVLAFVGWVSVPVKEVQIEVMTVQLEDATGHIQRQADVPLIETPQMSYFLAEDVLGSLASQQYTSGVMPLVLSSGARFNLPGYSVQAKKQGSGNATYKMATAPRVFVWEYVEAVNGPKELDSAEAIFGRIDALEAQRVEKLNPEKSSAKCLDRPAVRWILSALMIPLVLISWYLLRNFVEVSKTRYKDGTTIVADDKSGIARALIAILPALFLIWLWWGPATTSLHDWWHNDDKPTADVPVLSVAPQLRDVRIFSPTTNVTRGTVQKKVDPAFLDTCKKSSPKGRKALGCPTMLE